MKNLLLGILAVGIFVLSFFLGQLLGHSIVAAREIAVKVGRSNALHDECISILTSRGLEAEVVRYQCFDMTK